MIDIIVDYVPTSELLNYDKKPMFGDLENSAAKLVNQIYALVS